MAAISLASGRTVQVDNSVPPVILSGIAAAALTVGVFGKIGASGVATVSTNTETDGLILNTVSSGNGVGLLVFGIVTGYDLSGSTIGDVIYALQSNGTLNTASTSAIAIGKVVASRVESSGKALLVNCYEAML